MLSPFKPYYMVLLEISRRVRGATVVIRPTGGAGQNWYAGRYTANPTPECVPGSKADANGDRIRISAQPRKMAWTNHVPRGVTARRYLETSHLQYLKPEVQRIADWITAQCPVD